MKKVINIIIPVYNERDNIDFIYKELRKVEKEIRHKYIFDILFVNDGSKDDSQEKIEKLALKDKYVHYLEFSRNFGKEIATTAGISHAKGNAALMIDADAQFPPKLIPDFLEKWERGAEVITGIRLKNEKEGPIKKYGSALYNKIMKVVTDEYILTHSTDFRLLDRKVVDEFTRFTERNRITRGLIDWLGFRRDFIYFNAEARRAGEAKYGFRKLVRLAISSFVALSLFPLKFAVYLGVIITIFSGMLGLFIIIEQIVLEDPLGLHFSGPAILAVVNMFSSGIILLCMGFIALYIEHIHTESMNRPMFVVRNKKI